jgi:predicted N-formylglutamate amidohydrolase/dipeptidyl aminopeptidase/acylaminoacyl peptidase
MTPEQYVAAISAWSPSLSPDGSAVAYVSDRSGAPRLWVSRFDGAAPQCLETGDEPVQEVRWSHDGEFIAMTIAPGGGPRTDVWVVRPDGGDLRKLGGTSSGASFLGPWSPSSPLLAVSHTSTPPEGTAALYDARTGSATLLARGGQPLVFALDAEGRRALVRRGPRGVRSLWCVDLDSGGETELRPGGEDGSTDLGRLAPDGSVAYVRSNAGREYYVLFAFSLRRSTAVASGLFAERAESELEDLLLSADGCRAALFWNRAGRSECEIIDLVSGSRRDLLLPEPVAQGGGFSRDGRFLALALEGPTHPKGIYIADLEQGSFRAITSQAPGWVAPRATPSLEHLRAHDGLEISGWLYRTTEPGEPGKGAAVIHLHGGPESQERPTYNPLFQALAAHGIAVFAPNVRGSAGFGRTFINADNRERRFGAIADVVACVRHLIEQRVADPAKIACAGRSYGGYLTLAALVFHPELFAAGVDICGIADFATFYRDTEAWIAVAAYPKYGHPADDAELLRALSPLHHFKALRAPLLVVHGANDTNVPLGEAEQVVARATELGVPVEFLLFPDEGHELSKRENREHFVRKTVEWLRVQLTSASDSTSSLLDADDPPPFRAVEGEPSSPFLVTCDHAGRLLPRALGDLGLSPAELERHIAWDIGAAEVAERLARALGGFLILQTYSRLAIDCNRPLDSKSSIAPLSEATSIPGNQEVSALDAKRRADAIFHPYHQCIERELERRQRAGIATVYVAVHSFTPRFLDVDRAWHAGVLYGRDPRLARVLLDLLRSEPALVVGDNEPYFVSDLTDYGIVQHAERRGLLHVELEIRQDLVAHEAGQQAWAERLARVLRDAVARLDVAAR